MWLLCLEFWKDLFVIDLWFVILMNGFGREDLKNYNLVYVLNFYKVLEIDEI